MRYPAALFLTLLALVGLSGVSLAETTDEELISSLQKGGYVIYVRHPKTHGDQADTDPLNLENVKAQRQLTDEGRKHSQEIGAALRKLGVPVASVVSSKFKRAYEAAELMKVAPVTTTLDVSEGGLVVSPTENKRRTEALRQLLGTAPPTGKNTVIVGHKPNIVDAVGKAVLDISEGESIVFKPLGEAKFDLVGRIPVDKWTALGSATAKK